MSRQIVDVADVKQLMDDLAKPLFVMRMAWPVSSHNNEPKPSDNDQRVMQRMSADTRVKKACDQIDQIVRHYVKHTAEEDVA